MISYLFGICTAIFLGFFPYFEIYLAIPTAMAAGVNWFDAFLWVSIGNWLVIPLIDTCYDWFLNFKFMRKLEKGVSSSKWKKWIEKRGALIIFLLTPIVGSWTIAVAGKIINYDQKKLFILSAISIFVSSFIIALLTNYGISLFK